MYVVTCIGAGPNVPAVTAPGFVAYLFRMACERWESLKAMRRLRTGPVSQDVLDSEQVQHAWAMTLWLF